MPLYIKYIFSYFVGISMVIGWIRFKKLNPAFHPFVYLVTAGTVSEVLSFCAIRMNASNAGISNFYSLVEAMLILWQFQRWGHVSISKKRFAAMATLLAGVWCFENFWFLSDDPFNSYFIILSSFLVVLLTIPTMNVLIVQERYRLRTNATFLICLGFLFYFTYSIIVETCWMYGLNRYPTFQNHVYELLLYVNLFVNLMYAVAALWIPTKPRFLLPSSRLAS